MSKLPSGSLCNAEMIVELLRPQLEVTTKDIEPIIIMGLYHHLEQGDFTWNSGMFMWSVDVIIRKLRNYSPDIAEIMDKIAPAFFSEKEQDVVNELFPKCNKISIDYAVMEKTDIAYVIPADYGWSDLGTCGSLHTLTQHDENSNSVIGNNVKLVSGHFRPYCVPNI